MNINNLKEGQTIKNYKELCEILDIKHATNTTYKNKQLEELKLYCKFTKEGNKYIIEEIYNQPTITISDILKSKNNKYIKLLADIMLEQLYKNPKNLEQIPLIKLFTMLGVTNNNYKYANNYRKELSQLYNIQLASIYYFYSNTRNEFKKIIERCLNNLQKRSVLFWTKCIMIVETVKGEDDKKKIYKADKQTTELILDTQKETLQYLEINNMYELMKDKKKLKEFNSIIKKELTFNYYYAYDITVGQKAIQIEYNNILQERQKLNGLMIDKSNKLFDKEHYTKYKNDYDTLITLLIDAKCEKDIEESLELQYEDNLKMYFSENIIESNKYEHKLQEIKDKYIDTYKE